ncbi:MAG TPA: hypothetical protein VJ964_17870 [Balneolaceae bacterium]|nr:hypothetical protein [Balneolaceae bacterium]
MDRAEYLSRTYEFAPRGNQLPQTKLTPDQVRQCRDYSKTAREWAAILGVHYRTVEKARHYETHKGVF